jgi:hypothetical protein
MLLGVGIMTIYRILKDSAFEPDDVSRMGLAYERALALLGLEDRSDPITDIVAKLIIDVAARGEKDPEAICATALRRLRATDRVTVLALHRRTK